MPEIDEDDLEAELDALGDDFALDDDTSYLDDATKAPDAPEKNPGPTALPLTKMESWLMSLDCPKFLPMPNKNFGEL